MNKLLLLSISLLTSCGQSASEIKQKQPYNNSCLHTPQLLMPLYSKHDIINHKFYGIGIIIRVVEYDDADGHYWLYTINFKNGITTVFPEDLLTKNILK